MRTFFESVSNSSIGSPIVLVAANSVLNEGKLGIALKAGIPLAAFGLGAYAYHNKDNIESAVDNMLPTPEEKEKMLSDFESIVKQKEIETSDAYQRAKNVVYNFFDKTPSEQEKNHTDPVQLQNLSNGVVKNQ